MAFDRPIEADRVDDLGLFGSLIRAPVVGIMWLLGGEHDKVAEEEEKQKQDNERIEREMSGKPNGEDEGDMERENDDIDGHADTSKSCRDRGNADIDNIDDDDPPNVSSSDVTASTEQVNKTEAKGHDKENEEPSLQNWPSIGRLDSSDGDTSLSENKDRCTNADKSSTARPCSPTPDQSFQGENKMAGMNCAATRTIDDLVTAMESSHISSDSPGPASAILSQSKITSSDSLSASYSASTFSNHHNPSQNLSLHTSINNGVRLSPHSSLGSALRGSKKMSWSDECNGTLVEYFDDSAAPKSKHWSAMRRNSRKALRHSFDGGDSGAGSTRRSDVRVIKSALKRSGSYSPPVSLYASNERAVTDSTSSSTDSSGALSSTPEMRSFRSLSVIGSSDSSKSSSSERVSKESMQSQDTNDSMAAVTNKKLNSIDMQCVPSTLQVGCGLASGGLIIPRGGPADSRFYFPVGGPNDSRYQLILGAGTQGACGQETNVSSEQEERSETKDEKGDKEDETNEKPLGSPNPAPVFLGGRNSPGHHHHFLPRHHTNGYISPQYGFYVNITPPTPELYAARNSKSGDKPPRPAEQQQSYQQFQYQSKYQAPSPIPEGCPAQGFPQRFVGRSSVPRPSSDKALEEKDQILGTRKNALKPTFTKNKKGMGMLLAENPHHGVWPTVPFG